MPVCATNRLANVAVGLAILLLVALLVVLWTGSSAGIDRSQAGRNASDESGRPVFGTDLLRIGERFDEAESKVKAAEESTGLRPASLDEIRDRTWGHSEGEILPSGSGESVHIVLAKANQNSFEDPLDEHSKAERHHSGHFRHSQSKVWDPHPQYEFTAFGRKFHLRLTEDSSFAPPGVSVTRISENTSVREFPDPHLGCFYSGYVEGDPKSDVAVSLCHGMTGHIRTSSGNYFIKPTERWSNGSEKLAESLPLQHVIFWSTNSKNFDTISSATPNNRTANDLPEDYEPSSQAHGCAVIDNKEDDSEIAYDDTPDSDGHGRRRRDAYWQQDRDDGSYDEDGGRSFAFEGDQDYDLDIYGNWRSRRALPKEYFIEIMVVADAKMIEYHGSGLTSYILVLMNMVSRIHKDPSIGNPISIAVIKIKQIKMTFGIRKSGRLGIDAYDMQRKFCHWQRLNNPDDSSPEHHDMALLLTRENLCHMKGSEEFCDTLGLAELGRMCLPNASCTIVQDNGLATAFTIAHEIGHMLNAPHDDDHVCARFQDRSAVQNIMQRMLGVNTEPWKWSKCSRHYITEFLEAGLGYCLRDNPKTSNIISRAYGNRLPGEDYSENQQCELVYGAGSVICPHMGSEVCKRLWCTVRYSEDQSERCHTQHMPWADGTVCGRGKWCHHGECVSKENLELVHGQWGEWSAYEECSRTCGGGIKKKYRECDNPAPKNGGNYCIGERVRYRSCNTDECPPGSTDFREEQCAAFDNDNRSIRNVTKSVKWHAKYTRIHPEERCKLFCQVAGNQYYLLRDKVIDGTPCGPDTFHICVNGYCKPAGCDHMLNSTAALDTCGVCRGDNSTCQRITGSYNASEYGYTRVTEIPAGSSYIDVRQHGWNNSNNDSNYLVVRLKENGKYILNGNFTVMHRKVIIQPGVTLEYSGPDEVVERLNSSRPIHVDLVLEVLSVGNVYPPQISYEYTVPKKILDKYTWLLTEWSACDRICQGMTFRRAICQEAESKEIVPKEYCPVRETPREQSQTCNNHCELQWQEAPNSRTECSSHCGPGTLLVRYRCVQVPLQRHGRSLSPSTMSPRPVPSYACYHLERPSERHSCLGPCRDAHWQYGSWSGCSVTCGDNGFQYRSADCVDKQNRSVPEDKCPADGKIVRQSCGHKSCPKLSYGEWSSCSVTCGVGKRERPYWCQVDNRVVHPNLCKNLPRNIIESCDAGACATWQSGDWNSCSTTCGDGIRRRMINCKFANGSISRDCDIATRPISSISCALEPCPVKTTATPVTYSSNLPSYDLAHENDVDSHRITFRSGYSWIIGGFTECSKSCGGGFANQIVRCISVETNKIAPNEDYCDEKERPPDLVVCNEHQCPRWIPGGWNQCDVKCGDGYQHREILCQDIRGEILNDSDCSDKKPMHSRPCKRPPCVHSYGSPNAVTYKWRSGSWSECSASCGNGVKRREVTCHRINEFGWLDPSPVTGCSIGDKPPSEQFCKVRVCGDMFYWQASSWRKCSQPCGRKGRQVRRLSCYDLHGRKVRRRHCPANLRPQRKRKCNQKPCTGPTSCLEIQSRHSTDRDGEYRLLVGGMYMWIYCQGMQSSEPLEYLTLPKGERENYAEIYDKRLRDPHTCPFDGRRNDSCDCMTKTEISGRTMFKRVRINVHTLHIIANDYRFSVNMGKNNIEFGRAGDCYSKVNCPQGRFGIDLRGTNLMLAPEVHWPRQKNAYSIISRIDDQRVTGKCGGYCGFCSPSPGLKLNVLPQKV